jgi:glycosyltransferase involved in cell wall biosynthesis
MAAPRDGLYVVLVNWNGWRDTVDCLESLFRTRHYPSLRVLVCDNGSTDGSLERIRRWAKGDLPIEHDLSRGCGPFRLVEWLPGNHLVMDRWDKYFKPGQPYVDRVLLRIVKDPLTQVAALKAGEIDMILSFSPEHVSTLEAQVPGVKLDVLYNGDVNSMEHVVRTLVRGTTVYRDGRIVAEPLGRLLKPKGPA